MLCYLTLRRLSTDMEEAGFCGRGMMGVVANLGRGGGSGGGGGWYHEGWMESRRNNALGHFYCHQPGLSQAAIKQVELLLSEHFWIHRTIML